MALISQNFKNDTKGTSLSIRPIILLADRDLETGLYIPIDIYSVNNESIYSTCFFWSSLIFHYPFLFVVNLL